jgi:hypothetical protein
MPVRPFRIVSVNLNVGNDLAVAVDEMQPAADVRSQQNVEILLRTTSVVASGLHAEASDGDPVEQNRGPSSS